MNPAIAHILKFFKYDHLPPKLQMVSKPFCELAHAIALGDNNPESAGVTIGPPFPDNPETTVALRKLLEAKDAVVRAVLTIVVVLGLFASIGCSVLSRIPINLPTPPVASPKPPVTQPTPPTFPGPGPSTPPPVAKSCPQITDADAAPVDQTQQYAPDYASAILALKARHPDWSVQTDTGWRVPQAGDKHVYPTASAITAFRAQFYLELGQEFAKSGLCFVTIGDELHVYDSSQTPIVSERYKPFEQAQGNEEQKAFVGRTLAVVLGPAQQPTPAPPTPPVPAPTPAPASTPMPVAACPEPRPKGPIVKAKASIHNIGPAKVTLDASALFGPDPGYCAKAGWTDGRQYCQIRGECASDNVPCQKEHAACEAEFVPDPVWTSPLGADRAGFLLVIPKIEFEPGKPYTFTACFAAICGSVAVTQP